MRDREREIERERERVVLSSRFCYSLPNHSFLGITTSISKLSAAIRCDISVNRMCWLFSWNRQDVFFSESPETKFLAIAIKSILSLDLWLQGQPKHILLLNLKLKMTFKLSAKLKAMSLSSQYFQEWRLSRSALPSAIKSWKSHQLDSSCSSHWILPKPRDRMRVSRA